MANAVSGEAAFALLLDSPSFPLPPGITPGSAASKVVFDKMVQALEHQRIVSYLDVLNATLFVYDVILNLPLEIEHIWTRKWTFLTVLYIVQRYLPIFDTTGVNLHHDFGSNLTLRTCTLDWNIAPWSFISGVMLSEILLTLRVWAVWESKIPVAIGLVLFFLACWGPCSYFLAQFLSAVEFEILPFPNFRGCFIASGSNILYRCWVLWMVYDTGILVMILFPGVAAYRRGGRSELYATVRQDGVIYFAFIFLVSVINVIVALTLPPDLVHLLSSFERVVHSLLTSRAILHIRQIGARRSPPPTISYTDISLPAISRSSSTRDSIGAENDGVK